MSVASTPNASSPRNNDTSRPSPLACTNCRRKHLRCDAKQPICTRCAGGGLQCNYTPSRRGHRGPRGRDSEPPSQGRFSVPTALDTDRVNSLPQQPMLQAVETATVPPSLIHTQSSGYSPSDSDGRVTNVVESHSINYAATPSRQVTSSSSYRSTPAPSSSTDDKQLANLFYTYFHPAHPILVPSTLYDGRNYPSYLKLVVHFIGSHYSSSISNERLRLTVVTELADDSQKTPCMVQARLLLAIALHGRNEIKKAQIMLAQAVSLALEIGMNQRNFATTHGGQQSVEEESLRRTWWELYVVDGIMAGFWRKSEFSIHSFTSDVLLPCEEAIYMDAACVTNPPTVAQFDSRLFADDEMQFSSFCYRIEAARILARVLALTGAREVNQDQVQAVDNALAGWTHHLPPSKVDIINTFGEVDEILFL